MKLIRPAMEKRVLPKSFKVQCIIVNFRLTIDV